MAGAAGGVAALDAAARCCSALHTRQAPCAGVAPRRSRPNSRPDTSPCPPIGTAPTKINRRIPRSVSWVHESPGLASLGQFRAPGREVTGRIQGTGQLAGRSSRPAIRQSPNIPIERLILRGVSPLPGVFHRIRLDPLCRAGRRLAPRTCTIAKKSAFFREGEDLRIARVDRRNRATTQPTAGLTRNACTQFPSSPSLLSAGPLSRVHVSHKNDPDRTRYSLRGRISPRLRISRHAT
jgi:hypothetical protein